MGKGIKEGRVEVVRVPKAAPSASVTNQLRALAGSSSARRPRGSKSQ